MLPSPAPPAAFRTRPGNASTVPSHPHGRSGIHMRAGPVLLLLFLLAAPAPGVQAQEAPQPDPTLSASLGVPLPGLGVPGEAPEGSLFRSVTTPRTEVQRQSRSSGVEIQFLAGRTLYERSDYCGLYDFFVSSADLTLSRGFLGVSVTAILDYPWPLPPPDTFSYVDRGEAVQASVSLYPLQLLESTRELDAYFRPFVSGGVVASRDGEIRESRGASYNDGTPDGPVYGIRGRIDPALSFGATLALPVGNLVGARAAALVVDLRRTTLFGVEGEAEGPQGDLIRYESQELSWNEVRVGLRFGGGLR